MHELTGEGWDDRARDKVEAFLGGDFPGRKVAVFDWDHTSVAGDVGDSCLVHLLQQGGLRLHPDELAATLPGGELARGYVHTQLADGRDTRRLSDELLSCYQHLKGRAGERELVERVWDFYQSTSGAPTLGQGYAYGWVTQLLAGYHPGELVELARYVSGLPRQIPRERIVPVPEMRSLYAALQRRGFEVWVVSASQRDLVVGLASWDLYGYHVPPAQVVGMSLEQQPDGVYSPRLTGAFTWRQGKVEAIEHHIGVAPLLVAGDSPTDLEMLTRFEQTRLRLVIHRRQVEMAHLARLGLSPDPTVALQGLDVAGHRWVPLATSA